jgi:hypothetical protein
VAWSTGPSQHPVERIGIVGHSSGGKWVMFAACLDDEFACGIWSDPGVAFDEKRPNVNDWEPWCLGGTKTANVFPTSLHLRILARALTQSG